MLLGIDRAINLILGRQEFLALGSLKHDLALNQITKDLQTRLCQFQLRQLRLLTSCLPRDTSFDFLEHYGAAVNGCSDGAVACLGSSGTAPAKNDGD